VLILGVEQRVAHGTSLAAMIPTAVAGMVGFWAHGSIDWPIALVLALGSIGGAIIGTLLLDVASTTVLARILAVVLLLSALKLVAGSTTDVAARAPLTVGVVLAFVAVGLAAGALAGLMGVGGGVITIPAMVVLVNVAGAIARGTSLAVIVPTALVGTLRNVRSGNARVGLAVAIGAGGTVAAFGASIVSSRLSEPTSTYLLAGLLTCVAMRFALTARESGAVDVEAVDVPIEDGPVP
jgi:uncharacterized membrane protein YfcA